MLSIQTHDFIKELIGAGFTERQAEVIVRQQEKIINENLATKNDITLLGKDMELMKKDLIIKICGFVFGALVVAVGVILTVLPMMLTAGG